MDVEELEKSSQEKVDPAGCITGLAVCNAEIQRAIQEANARRNSAEEKMHALVAEAEVRPFASSFHLLFPQLISFPQLICFLSFSS